MSKVIQILKKHPWAIISYILYAFLCYNTITSELQFKAAIHHIEHGDKVAWGEGIMYGDILLFMIAALFIAITILNVALRKSGQSFYLWLCVFIAIPLIFLMKISG